MLASFVESDCRWCDPAAPKCRATYRSLPCGPHASPRARSTQDSRLLRSALESLLVFRLQLARPLRGRRGSATGIDARPAPYGWSPSRPRPRSRHTVACALLGFGAIDLPEYPSAMLSNFTRPSALDCRYRLAACVFLSGPMPRRDAPASTFRKLSRYEIHCAMGGICPDCRSPRIRSRLNRVRLV